MTAIGLFDTVFHSGYQVLQVCRHISCELIHEDVLVQVAHTKLEEHLSQICNIDDFLFLVSLTLEVSYRFCIGAEHLLIS